jgi:hypothetical protein
MCLELRIQAYISIIDHNKGFNFWNNTCMESMNINCNKTSKSCFFFLTSA